MSENDNKALVHENVMQRGPDSCDKLTVRISWTSSFKGLSELCQGVPNIRTLHMSVHSHTAQQTTSQPLPAVAFPERTCIIDQGVLCKTKKERHRESPASALENILWKRRAALKSRRGHQLWASGVQRIVQSSYWVGKAECSQSVWKVTILPLSPIKILKINNLAVRRSFESKQSPQSYIFPFRLKRLLRTPKSSSPWKILKLNKRNTCDSVSICR